MKTELYKIRCGNKSEKQRSVLNNTELCYDKRESVINCIKILQQLYPKLVIQQLMESVLKY